MLVHASIPVTYWNDTFSNVAYLINRLPSAPLGYISPYEKLFQTKPNYSFLRTFGCLYFPNLRLYNKLKLQFLSTPCIFLGYSTLHKGYRCQDSNGRIYISRHVTFHEDQFQFKDTCSKTTPVTTPSHTSSRLMVLAPRLNLHGSSAQSSSQPTLSLPPSLPTSLVCPQPDSPISPMLTGPSIASLTHSLVLVPISSPIPTPQNSDAMVTRSKAGIFKPKFYISGVDLSPDVPTNVHAAMAHPLWKEAVLVELDALVRNNTWTL